jgi:hypothetical protein
MNGTAHARGDVFLSQDRALRREKHRMLQAWIVSPRESVYFTAAATPCSVKALQRHVRRMQRRLHGRLHLTLRLGDLDVGVEVAGVAAFIQQLASEGVAVTLEGTESSSRHSRRAGNGTAVTRLAAARLGENGDRPSASPTTS